MKPTKQTWEQMAEELRMEIEQWQNPIFETIMGPLPLSIVNEAMKEEFKEAEDLLIENQQVLSENDMINLAALSDKNNFITESNDKRHP